MRGAARQGDPLALLILAAGCRAKPRRDRGAIASFGPTRPAEQAPQRRRQAGPGGGGPGAGMTKAAGRCKQRVFHRNPRPTYPQPPSWSLLILRTYERSPQCTHRSGRQRSVSAESTCSREARVRAQEGMESGNESCDAFPSRMLHRHRDKALGRLPASRFRGDRLPWPSRRSRGIDRIPVSKRESALHDAWHPLTRFGRSPNASRLAHRSKSRHRDRQTALTGQPCNGKQANAKNDVEWRHRDRDHAGR